MEKIPPVYADLERQDPAQSIDSEYESVSGFKSESESESGAHKSYVWNEAQRSCKSLSHTNLESWNCCQGWRIIFRPSRCTANGLPPPCRKREFLKRERLRPACQTFAAYHFATVPSVKVESLMFKFPIAFEGRQNSSEENLTSTILHLHSAI